MKFAESYLGGLRALVGSRPLLVIGVRVLVENRNGEFLIIRRADTGTWGLPSGSMELGESLLDTVHREVLEEANLRLHSITAFGLSSDPSVERHTYPNGDVIQNVSLLVHAYPHDGKVASNDGEATDFRFCAADRIDETTFVKTEFPTFAHWRRFREKHEFQFV